MKKKNKEIFLAWFVAIGFLLVVGGVGGVETDVASFSEGILISFLGFSLMVVAIFIGNRENITKL